MPALFYGCFEPENVYSKYHYYSSLSYLEPSCTVWYRSRSLCNL